MNPGDIPRIAAPLLTLARKSVGKCVCVCVWVCWEGSLGEGKMEGLEDS